MDTLNEFNIKFNLDSPQDKNTEIEIALDAEGDYLYKFLIGLEGKWNTLSDFSGNKTLKWMPDKYGTYTIMVQIRKMDSSKSFDYVSKTEYEVREADKRIKIDSRVSIDDIVMDNRKHFVKGEKIHIKVLASGSNDIRYSFIVKKDGENLEEIKYGSCSWVDFTPELTGDFQLEIRIKDKYSQAEFDSLQVVPIEVSDYIPADIEYLLMPVKEYHIVSDPVALEAIVNNTDQVRVKYILKINGHVIEETDFVDSKKYMFVPKCSGQYSVSVLAKNINSSSPYDCSKEVRITVHEYYPITDAVLRCDMKAINAGSSVTFSAVCKGGRDVVYEFWIMENGQWELVQSYSKKNYYMMIPFNKGSYRILALMKSASSRLPYENYGMYAFDIV